MARGEFCLERKLKFSCNCRFFGKTHHQYSPANTRLLLPNRINYSGLIHNLGRERIIESWVERDLQEPLESDFRHISSTWAGGSEKQTCLLTFWSWVPHLTFLYQFVCEIGMIYICLISKSIIMWGGKSMTNVVYHSVVSIWFSL